MIDDLIGLDSYRLPRADKRAVLLRHLNDLTVHHARHCAPYRDILLARGVVPGEAAALEDVPMLPVRLFKSHMLSSVGADDVVKVLTSSGTTGQQVSRIPLDRATAKFQTRAVVAIMTSFIGKVRRPMLIVDHPGVVSDRESFSARGAGILGMANFGRDHTYVLRDGTMELDLEKLEGFLGRHAGSPVLIFGFTFMVWEYFLGALERLGRTVDLSGAVLVHSGGWKKLADRAVDNDTFKRRLRAAAGIGHVHNFYGMVEQVGSIFVECEHGALHTPNLAEVIVRDPYDWRAMPTGGEGVIQVLSCLPHSYPGHSLLTEDRGVVTGEDDCPCGRMGRTFRVLGRLPQAEIRGCSDTHAQAVAA